MPPASRGQQPGCARTVGLGYCEARIAEVASGNGAVIEMINVHIRASASTRLACILIAPASAATIGLAEWASIGFDASLTQAQAAMTLLAILALYWTIGVVAGLVCAGVAGRLRDPRAAVVCLAPAVAALAEIVRSDTANPLGLFAGAALGWVGYRIAVWVTARFSWLGGARLWWCMQGAGAAIALGFSVRRGSDGLGLALAVGVGVIALALVASSMRSARTGSRDAVTGAAFAVLVVILASACLGQRVAGVAPAARAANDVPSVLLVTIDTLRADRVGAYGYARARTPNIDALAKLGTLFRTVVAPAVFTGPSHASILTGMLPVNHRVIDNKIRLDASIPTLAEALRAERYVTGAFVSGFTTIDSAVGLPSRFHGWDDDLRGFPWFSKRTAQNVTLVRALRKALTLSGVNLYPPDRPATRTVTAAVEWLAKNGGRPYFAWVHLFDPHLPYEAPARFLEPSEPNFDGPVDGHWYGLDASQRTAIVTSPRNVNRMLELYDAEVAYADHELGRLLAAAREAAPGGELLIVVTADHGESMGERDLYWFRDLYDPTLLVPLIVVAPDDGERYRREVGEQVRLIDIAPTLLDLVGVEPLVAIDGQSLVPLMSSGSDAPGPAYSAIYVPEGKYHRERYSVRDGEWKLIHRAAGWRSGGPLPWYRESKELYDLRQDPGETHNLHESPPPILSDLEAVLGANALSTKRERVPLTAEERERLKALGYIR